MSTLKHLLNLFVCGLMLTVSGCGGRSTASTEPVQGVVTLDGQPVEGATVTFVPKTEGQGLSATGRTDAQGVYRLTAVATGEQQGAAEAGTKPGDYYVGVIKREVEVPLGPEEAAQAGVAYVESTPASPKVTYVVPQRYGNPQKSGIEVTVTAGTNEIPIELTK